MQVCAFMRIECLCDLTHGFIATHDPKGPEVAGWNLCSQMLRWEHPYDNFHDYLRGRIDFSEVNETATRFGFLEENWQGLPSTFSSKTCLILPQLCDQRQKKKGWWFAEARTAGHSWDRPHVELYLTCCSFFLSNAMPGNEALSKQT